MTLLNTGLIRNPLNWATLFLMVLIAGVGLHFILSHVTFLKIANPGEL